MKKAFSFALALAIVLSLSLSVFAAGLDEAAFEGVIVGYMQDGVPIVDDPTAVSGNVLFLSAVTAKTVVNAGMYSDRRLNNILLYIPKGKTVPVIETDDNYGSVKVTYAGNTGWVSGADLQLA